MALDWTFKMIIILNKYMNLPPRVTITIESGFDDNICDE
jgi:hypothetical protein